MAFSFKNALSRCVYSRIRITHLQIQEVYPTSKLPREGTPSIKMRGGGKHTNSVVPGVSWIGASGALPTHCIVFCKLCSQRRFFFYPF